VSEYVLKYSGKQIVLNLNFNNRARTYQYDTAQYCNFWAADEPLKDPLPADTSCTITGLNPSTAYHFSLKCISDHSVTPPLAPEKKQDPGLEETTGLAASPNPFNPAVCITYRLQKKSPAWLGVFDLSGRLVRVLQEGTVQPEGPRIVSWNGRDQAGLAIASGVYLLCLKTPGFSQQRTVTFIK
jgi:hypothetical protein